MKPISLVTLLLLTTAATAQPTPGRIPEPAELVSRLTHLVDSLATRGEFSGVVLLARNGEVLMNRAWGSADRESRRPIGTETEFNTSSIGKLFTQVAIRQLVREGKLDLDSPLARYWPDYPNQEVARAVTVRQLLTHRSGIGGNIFKPEALRSLRHNRDYLPLFVDEPLRFAPGTREEYSNAGYVVLGELISRLSGEDYYSYLQRHVFDPAAMRSTHFHMRDSLPPSAATGYSRLDPSGNRAAPETPPHRNDGLQPMRGSAAGGVYSTTGDLLRFLTARRAGKLGDDMNPGSDMTAGGSPGSNGAMSVGLPGGYDLIVLANLDPPSATTIAERAEKWLTGTTAGVGKRESASESGSTRPVVWTTFPGTSAGTRAAEYLRVFNSGDQGAMRIFLESSVVPDPNRPTEKRVEGYTRLFAQHGTLTPQSLVDETETSLTLIAGSQHSGEIKMIVTVEPAAPHRIVSVGFNIDR